MEARKSRSRRKPSTKSKKPLPRQRKSKKSKLSRLTNSRGKNTKLNPKFAARVDHKHHAPVPRTAKILTRKSTPRVKRSYADSSMSLTDLQFMAKSAGIPFGGLSRSGLVRKINAYR